MLSFKSVLFLFCSGYILDHNPLSDVLCKYFFSVCGLSSYSLHTAFHRADVLHFNEVQLINYFFHRSCPWCCIQKKITIPKGIWVLSCVLPSGDVGAVIFWLMWKEAEGSEQGPFLNHSAQLTWRSPDHLCAWHTRALGLQSRAPRPWRTPFYRTKLIK